MDSVTIKRHFDSIAGVYDKYKRRNAYYHNKITKLICSTIPAGKSVLEIGCATGDLLNSVSCATGVGVDISPNMIEIAKKKYPHLKFYVQPAENIRIDDKFDYIIASNLFDYLADIEPVLENIKKLLNVDGKIIITTVNPVWEPVFRIGERLKLRTPDTIRNFITNKDILNLLELHGFKVMKEGLKVFLPKYIPVLSGIINFIIPELPMLRQLCVIQYSVAKLKRPKQPLSCSVIVPCHNEEDNIAECLRRIPRMGEFTEAIVVDDGSADATAAKVTPDLNPDIEIRLISYKPNQGKGHAVKEGFEQSKGDVLMILDADMAVIPEELPRFFKPIEEGLADFVNGSRIIYPMQRKAMPILNYVGNKIFSLVLSWIIGQRISDTLCGTKVMLKKDYRNMVIKDISWGDFDLLFSAARLCLEIREVPVHYMARTAGQSKMKAFKHGWVLLKVCWRGFKELKLK